MISNELKCVFVHCQKCAGESIEKAVFGRADKNYGGDIFEGSPMKHYSANQYIEKMSSEVWDEYFTFSFVRNPWDRVISWIKYRDLRYNRQDKLTPNKIMAEVKQPMFKSFNYTNMLFDSNGKILVDFIGRFEEIEHDFDIVRSRLGIKSLLPVLNKTQHKPYWCYYDQEAIDLVAKIYKNDIENFGFEFGKRKFSLLNNGRQGPINGRPILSILIASLRSRKLKLERLLTSLGTHSGVEALVEVDDGELSIGLKRQTLLDRANGKYIVYLDDDDIVAENFVAKILENIKFNPDAIGYWIEHHKDGHKQFIKKMTLGLTSQVMYQGDLLSPLTHRSVVKRKILNEFTFPNIDWAEDRPYWAHIQKKIRWEKVILLEDILYYQFEISAKYSSDGNHNGQ